MGCTCSSDSDSDWIENLDEVCEHCNCPIPPQSSNPVRVCLFVSEFKHATRMDSGCSFGGWMWMTTWDTHTHTKADCFKVRVWTWSSHNSFCYVILIKVQLDTGSFIWVPYIITGREVVFCACEQLNKSNIPSAMFVSSNWLRWCFRLELRRKPPVCHREVFLFVEKPKLPTFYR